MLAYRFRGTVHYLQDMHGSVQADMVQEDLRDLHLRPKEARNRLSILRHLEKVSLSPPPRVKHFLQQGHTF